MRISLIVLFTIQLLAAVGCYPQDVRLTQPTPVRTVEVLEVRAASTRDTLPLIGLIEPIQDVILYFEVTGQVRQVFVNEGDIVEAGAPLAELVPDDLELAVTQLTWRRVPCNAKLPCRTKLIPTSRGGFRHRNIVRFSIDKVSQKNRYDLNSNYELI